MYFRTALLFITFAFWSCDDEPVATSITTPFVEMELGHPHQLSTIALLEKSSFIHPELTDQSGIDRIEKVAMVDQKIFIVNHLERSNSKSVMAFDQNGRFQWSRSSHSDTPGKFPGYTDFTIGQQNNIEILDGLKQKIVKYDLAGNYLSSILLHTDAQRLAPFRDGSYAVHRNNTYQFGKTTLEYNLVFTDEKGEQSGRTYLFMPPVMRDMKLSGERFFPRREQDGYFCINPPFDTIYHCSPGNVIPLFALNYPEKRAKDAALHELQQEPSFISDRGAYNLAFLNFLNNPAFISTYDLVTERDAYYLLSFRRNIKRYFVKIDKANLKSTVYTFDNSLLDQTHVFLLDKDVIALTLRNPYTLKQWLADRNPQLHNQWFADLTDTEPNPILILIDLAALDDVGLLSTTSS